MTKITFTKLAKDGGEMATGFLKANGEVVGEVTVWYRADDGGYGCFVESITAELDTAERYLESDYHSVECRDRLNRVLKTPVEARREIKAWAAKVLA